MTEPCISARDYHCATHDRQWIDDEADRCEYKRMLDAEAAIQRVREVLNEWRADDNESLTTFGQHNYVALAACADMLQRALDGGAE